jgi:hypothetical protein
MINNGLLWSGKGIKNERKRAWKDDNSMTQHCPKTEYVACLDATLYL